MCFQVFQDLLHTISFFQYGSKWFHIWPVLTCWNCACVLHWCKDAREKKSLGVSAFSVSLTVIVPFVRTKSDIPDLHLVLLLAQL